MRSKTSVKVRIARSLGAAVTLIAVLVAGSAAWCFADPPEDPDDHQTPPSAIVSDFEPGLPGMLGQEPTPKGRLYRSLTLIEPLEWQTPDPTYRWTLQQIAAGLADARVMRLHYWLKQRLSPFERPIPEGWREAALARLRAPRPTAPDTDGGLDQAQLPAFGRWMPFGPTTIPGRVTGLAWVPHRPGWILAAMADGGLWLTKDNGASWDPLTEREATQASGAVATDPRDPDVFYWATGEGNGAIDNYGGIGVLRTADAGRTWHASNEFSNSFRCLRADPEFPLRLWACGDAGLYRSDDGAASFYQVEGGLPTDAGGTALVFRPGAPQTMFAGLWNRGVWKSIDAGTSWTQVEGGLPPDLGRNDVAVCDANPDVMVVASGLNGGDLWKSLDGGQSWSELTGAPDHCGGQCWYDNVVAIAPDDCDTVYSNGVGFHVSRDGGQSWGGTSSSIHVDHHAILTGLGGEVIVGDDGGVYRSTDYGHTFSNSSSGLPSTQYYGACGHDTDPGWVAGGTQDRGTHRRRDSDGWRLVLGGDGGMCALAGDKMLGEYQVTNLQRSLNGGDGFESANSGIRPEDPKAWVGIIEKDPGDGDTLYVGTSRIYRTTDFHDTPWVEIFPPLFYGRLVSALAVSPLDRNVLWAGFEVGGLYRTSNALAARPSFDDIRGGLPLRTVRRIVPHPNDVNAAWIIHAGYGYPKIYYTSDGGTSFADVSGDIPDVPINDLVVDAGDTDVLIAATDLGIFRSTDGGTTWHGFSDGLPAVAVVELFRHPADGSLIAGTHGRSMFRFRAASDEPVAVPDGQFVGGRSLVAERTSADELWIRFDTEACTAERYHLFFGELTQAAEGPYADAVCDLDRGGEQVLPMLGEPSQSLFFVVAGATGAGNEGPHGYRSDGTVRPHQASGLCGIVTQQTVVSCP
ncbi:MAG: hypothetical protein JSV80_18410 [Acidobacteriota bacterium]|nr:MAG: hypothetical protein JSV80_18410 [Acidobacteriota bacterium]